GIRDWSVTGVQTCALPICSPLSDVASHCAAARPLLAFSPAVQYSASIDAGSRGLRRKSLVQRLYGFRQCKVKVGADGEDDTKRLDRKSVVEGKGGEDGGRR